MSYYKIDRTRTCTISLRGFLAATNNMLRSQKPKTSDLPPLLNQNAKQRLRYTNK